VFKNSSSVLRGKLRDSRLERNKRIGRSAAWEPPLTTEGAIKQQRILLTARKKIPDNARGQLEKGGRILMRITYVIK
jgi:hypothetical protein